MATSSFGMGGSWPPPNANPNTPSSHDSLSSGAATADGLRRAQELLDLQQLVPKRGRLGVEEIPFQGRDPVPQIVVPTPVGGWGAVTAREDALQRFENRNTQGLDGGGRSTNITRFTPQLEQWQQPDDASRIHLYERNNPSLVKADERPYV